MPVSVHIQAPVTQCCISHEIQPHALPDGLLSLSGAQPVSVAKIHLPFGSVVIKGPAGIHHSTPSAGHSKYILDACCGPRGWWHNKKHPLAIYTDIRKGEYELCPGRTIQVDPDTVADFRQLPFSDSTFAQVYFDPPHLKHAGTSSRLAKRYGTLNPATWQEDIARGFAECWRVLAPCGTLVFKWSDVQLPLSRVLTLLDHEPTITHTANKTHFCIFFKTP